MYICLKYDFHAFARISESNLHEMVKKTCSLPVYRPNWLLNYLQNLIELLYLTK